MNLGKSLLWPTKQIIIIITTSHEVVVGIKWVGVNTGMGQLQFLSHVSADSDLSFFFFFLIYVWIVPICLWIIILMSLSE